MKSAIILVVFLIGIVVTQPDEVDTVAREFVDLLAKEDFTGASRTFDETMIKALPPKKLQQIWTALIGQVGRYEKQVATRKQKIQQYDVVFVTCQFERGTLDVKVVLDNSRKVAGLFFLPSQYAYDPPPYAKSSSYEETEVLVGAGKWALPGTLTVPCGEGPFAAVVLVHGSGPQDRDETIGSNKPFRDLAWGLASKGIAVLRYEKRTKQHATLLVPIKDEITVDEETVADALAAVALLRESPEVDKRNIFVLGHSLGGMLVPRIGQRDRQIAGFIIMAGTSRPMEDVVLEQLTYAFSLDDQITEDEQEQLQQLKNQVAIVKSQQLSKETPASLLPLGISASYWLDLRGYDPAQEAAHLAVPIFILQGKRDYQVTMDDYTRWTEALSTRQNVQFKLYPTLNHLFMSGTDKSVPAEYEKSGHVEKEVIDDIAEWIEEHSQDKPDR